MKFEKYSLDSKIKRALDELGFVRPTDIQFKSIPNIQKREDLLAVAQTGTGKTAAFAIPIIDIIYKQKRSQRRSDGVKCLILVPTHELAIQLDEVFKSIGKYTTVKSLAIYGGVDQDPQIKSLNKGVDIVIATPGRMFDLISQGHLLTNRIDVLVLDEADHMLDLGFIVDIEDLMHKLPRRRQTLFFSATINERIKKIAYKIIRQNAIRIQISPKDPVSRNVDHSVIFVEMDHKRFFLERVIQENPDAKILVFARTRVRVERVKKAMERVGIEALAIHGDKDQDERNRILSNFKLGKVNVLIATDVTARGIDIPEIQLVINYDMPEQAENYVHRVGRTGRGKNRGTAYSFCSEIEKPILDEVTNYINNEIRVLNLSKMEYQDTLNIDRERTHDYKSILNEIEEFENLKKKKKRKK